MRTWDSRVRGVPGSCTRTQKAADMLPCFINRNELRIMCEARKSWHLWTLKTRRLRRRQRKRSKSITRRANASSILVSLSGIQGDEKNYSRRRCTAAQVHYCIIMPSSQFIRLWSRWVSIWRLLYQLHSLSNKLIRPNMRQGIYINWPITQEHLIYRYIHKNNMQTC